MPHSGSWENQYLQPHGEMTSIDYMIVLLLHALLYVYSLGICQIMNGLQGQSFLHCER